MIELGWYYKKQLVLTLTFPNCTQYTVLSIFLFVSTDLKLGFYWNFIQWVFALWRKQSIHIQTGGCKLQHFFEFLFRWWEITFPNQIITKSTLIKTKRCFDRISHLSTKKQNGGTDWIIVKTEYKPSTNFDLLFVSVTFFVNTCSGIIFWILRCFQHNIQKNPIFTNVFNNQFIIFECFYTKLILIFCLSFPSFQ